MEKNNNSKNLKAKLSDIIIEQLYLEMVASTTTTLKELDRLLKEDEIESTAQNISKDLE